MFLAVNLNTASQIHFYSYCRIRKNKFYQALNFHINCANFIDYLFFIFKFFYQWGIEQFTEWENCMWKIIKEWSFCGLLCLWGCSVRYHIAAAGLVYHFTLSSEGFQMCCILSAFVLFFLTIMLVILTYWSWGKIRIFFVVCLVWPLPQMI